MKSQLTALSEENISLESHAKKLRDSLETAEGAQEVTNAVVLELVWLIKEITSLQTAEGAQEVTNAVVLELVWLIKEITWTY